jgi:hypothetical protein
VGGFGAVKHKRYLEEDYLEDKELNFRAGSLKVFAWE